MITARLATRYSRLAILAWLLAGCGFQPRGQAQLPPELAVVSVQSQQAIGAPPGALSRRLPLLLFHDVCWPHGRRDSYYAPDRIPDEYRETIAEGVGIAPEEPGLTYGGFPYKWVQEREGGERNGVLTAVEDFLAERDDLELAIVPIFFMFIPCVPLS